MIALLLAAHVCPIPQAVYRVADTGDAHGEAGWSKPANPNDHAWRSVASWERCVCGPAGHTDENEINRNDAGVPVASCIRDGWNGRRYRKEKV
jgi:hypothetical protein